MKAELHPFDPRGTQPRQTNKIQILRHCNICRSEFLAKNSYILFCNECRKSNESIRFSEWMPVISEIEISESLLDSVA